MSAVKIKKTTKQNDYCEKALHTMSTFLLQCTNGRYQDRYFSTHVHIRMNSTRVSRSPAQVENIFPTKCQCFVRCCVKEFPCCCLAVREKQLKSREIFIYYERMHHASCRTQGDPRVVCRDFEFWVVLLSVDGKCFHGAHGCHPTVRGGLSPEPIGWLFYAVFGLVGVLCPLFSDCRARARLLWNRDSAGSK